MHRLLAPLACFLSAASLGCGPAGEISRHTNIKLSWGSKVVHDEHESFNIRGEGTTLIIVELTPEDKAAILNLLRPLPGAGWARTESARRAISQEMRDLTKGLDREQLRKLRAEKDGSYSIDKSEGRDRTILYIPDANNALYYFRLNI